jgi:hypothetical protein
VWPPLRAAVDAIRSVPGSLFSFLTKNYLNRKLDFPFYFSSKKKIDSFFDDFLFRFSFGFFFREHVVRETKGKDIFFYRKLSWELCGNISPEQAMATG